MAISTNRRTIWSVILLNQLGHVRSSRTLLPGVECGPDPSSWPQATLLIDRPWCWGHALASNRSHVLREVSHGQEGVR